MKLGPVPLENFHFAVAEDHVPLWVACFTTPLPLWPSGIHWEEPSVVPLSSWLRDFTIRPKIEWCCTGITVGRVVLPACILQWLLTKGKWQQMHGNKNVLQPLWISRMDSILVYVTYYLLHVFQNCYGYNRVIGIRVRSCCFRVPKAPSY